MKLSKAEKDILSRRLIFLVFGICGIVVGYYIRHIIQSPWV